MKMCEYANNLFDMKLLLYLTDKNRRIVFVMETYPSLLFVNSDVDAFYIVFPRMYGDLDYIRLDKDDIISFNKTNKIGLDLKYHIRYV